jgi:hypothetical protein
MDSPASTIAELIRTEDDFLVAAHANPDGDALGSTVALGHLLRFQSKRFHLYNYTGMTAACDWLNPPAPVHTSLPSWKPRVCFILDCGALDRVGEELLPALDACQVVNVDHHIGNPAFGDLNWVDRCKAIWPKPYIWPSPRTPTSSLTPAPRPVPCAWPPKWWRTAWSSARSTAKYATNGP